METQETRLRQEGTARQQFTFGRFLTLARDESYDRLAAIRTAFWSEAADEHLTDGQAAYVDEIFAARLGKPKSVPTERPPRARDTYVGTRPITSESLKRRRALASENWLTVDDRRELTQGHAALASAVLEEIMARGACELHVDKLAALAGICRRWAQHGLRMLEKLGIIAVELRPADRRRHDTSRITLNPVRADTYARRLHGRKHWWRGRNRAVPSQRIGRISDRTTRHRLEKSVPLKRDNTELRGPKPPEGLSGGETARSVPARPMRTKPG